MLVPYSILFCCLYECHMLLFPGYTLPIQDSQSHSGAVSWLNCKFNATICWYTRHSSDMIMDSGWMYLCMRGNMVAAEWIFNCTQKIPYFMAVPSKYPLLWWYPTSIFFFFRKRFLSISTIEFVLPIFCGLLKKVKPQTSIKKSPNSCAVA